MWKGERMFSVANDLSRPLAPQADYACLTPHERQVLFHVLEGHPNRVIAQHFGVTEGAAKVDLENLLRKMNVDNRTQATIWALANLPEIEITLLALSERKAIAPLVA
jgi:DNA-binding NarL/FixJ family response regulator